MGKPNYGVYSRDGIKDATENVCGRREVKKTRG